jgi:DNA invertase Pin-like site-specific DNA recombinase
MDATINKEPAAMSNAAQDMEFGRFADIQRIFGLSRGTIYNLLKAGKINGHTLRIKGATSRARLIEIASVRAYIKSQTEKPEGDR